MKIPYGTSMDDLVRMLRTNPLLQALVFYLLFPYLIIACLFGAFMASTVISCIVGFLIRIIGILIGWQHI
jgi:hypothetical protein